MVSGRTRRVKIRVSSVSEGEGIVNEGWRQEKCETESGSKGIIR